MPRYSLSNKPVQDIFSCMVEGWEFDFHKMEAVEIDSGELGPIQPRWSANPWFQREQVWDPQRKQMLIDTVVRGLPIGQVTIWGKRGTQDIIDGKQRCSTLVSFLKNEFRDDRGKFWREWDPREQGRFVNSQIAVQEIMLDHGEGEDVITELFQRMNSLGKKLTTGELLNSCGNLPIVKFTREIFFNPIENSEDSEKIEEFRDNWETQFCKGDEYIVKEAKTHGELAVLVPFVTTLVTGNNKCITTSYDHLVNQGLKTEISAGMRKRFFERTSIMWRLIHDSNIEPNARGYPSLAPISPMLYMVNMATSGITSEELKDASSSVIKEYLECKVVMDRIDEFFAPMCRENPDTQLKEIWKTRLRANRNVGNIRKDISYMYKMIKGEEPEGEKKERPDELSGDETEEMTDDDE